MMKAGWSNVIVLLSCTIQERPLLVCTITTHFNSPHPTGSCITADANDLNRAHYQPAPDRKWLLSPEPYVLEHWFNFPLPLAKKLPQVCPFLKYNLSASDTYLGLIMRVNSLTLIARFMWRKGEMWWRAQRRGDTIQFHSVLVWKRLLAKR